MRPITLRKQNSHPDMDRASNDVWTSGLGGAARKGRKVEKGEGEVTEKGSVYGQIPVSAG